MTDQITGGDDLRFRVSELDRSQAAIRAEQAALKADMKEGFNNVFNAIKGISDEVKSSQKPNWQLYVTVIGLFFTLIVGFVGMVKGPSDARIDRLEAISMTTTGVMPSLMTKDDYRAERDRNLANVQRQLDGMETREAKHDDRIEKQLDALDTKFENFRSRREK